MLMHKLLGRLYSYLAKVFDRKAARVDAKRKERDERWAEVYPEGLPSSSENLEVKNPCRFL